MRRPAQTVSAETLATIRMPVLIAVGERDKVAGSPEGLARLIPGAELLVIPNRDHMLATGDQDFKERVLEFPRAAAVMRCGVCRTGCGREPSPKPI